MPLEAPSYGIQSPIYLKEAGKDLLFLLTLENKNNTLKNKIKYFLQASALQLNLLPLFGILRAEYISLL